MLCLGWEKESAHLHIVTPITEIALQSTIWKPIVIESFLTHGSHTPVTFLREVRYATEVIRAWQRAIARILLKSRWTTNDIVILESGTRLKTDNHFVIGNFNQAHHAPCPKHILLYLTTICTLAYKFRKIFEHYWVRDATYFALQEAAMSKKCSLNDSVYNNPIHNRERMEHQTCHII